MAVQVAPDVERTRAGAEMTPDEAKTALADYIAYFGTYTVDEKAAHRDPSSPGQHAAGRQRRSGARLRIRRRPVILRAAAQHEVLGTDQVKHSHRRPEAAKRLSGITSRAAPAGRAPIGGYEFAGDRLILRPGRHHDEVVWERIK